MVVFMLYDSISNSLFISFNTKFDAVAVRPNNLADGTYLLIVFAKFKYDVLKSCPHSDKQCTSSITAKPNVLFIFKSSSDFLKLLLWNLSGDININWYFSCAKYLIISSSSTSFLI